MFSVAWLPFVLAVGLLPTPNTPTTQSVTLHGRAHTLHVYGDPSATHTAIVASGDGGWMHLAFNMYVLYALGPTLERILGHSRYLVLYVLAALGGGVASYAFSSFNTIWIST